MWTSRAIGIVVFLLLALSTQLQQLRMSINYCVAYYGVWFYLYIYSKTQMIVLRFCWQRFLTLFILFHAAALGAILHVISTSLLGITAITMANTIAGEETVHKVASLLLVFLGGSYILLFLTGKGGHSHSHNQPMEKMAVAGLILVPALSPCATTLPVFLAVGNSSSMMVLAIVVLLFRYELIASNNRIFSVLLFYALFSNEYTRLLLP